MMLQNLIGNSLKYRSPDRAPEIKITVRNHHPDEDWVEISIEDNGVGFDNEYATKIFQPFERLHSNKEYPGTGIGLSICRKIVEHHHGQIEASGIAGVGAKFVVRLPLKQQVTEKA